MLKTENFVADEMVIYAMGRAKPNLFDITNSGRTLKVKDRARWTFLLTSL